MGKYASVIVKQAQAWVGRKESDGSHKLIIDIYNSHKPLARGYKVKYDDAWCSTFVSAVAVECGYTDIIPTECGCEKHTKLFKNIGSWQENENVTPKAGWIIFYDWNDNGKGDDKGSADHVGIVEKVSGKKITVIEGNYNSSVARRTLEVNAKYIRGYGVPKYDEEPKAEPEQEEKKDDSFKAGTKLGLSNTPLYASSTADKAAGKVTGTYYLWDNEVVNGRIRITNKTSNVGKAGQVTGWVGIDWIQIEVPKEEPKATPKTFKVRVDKSCGAMVRVAPNTKAALSGSKFLDKGDIFEATEVVTGEKVNGNDKWYHSKVGNYVWSGGLTKI